MITGIAIVGCGYAADFYVMNLQNYPELRLVGAYDRNVDRLNAFHNHYGTHSFTSLTDLLSDTNVELVLNLTNPSQHYRVSLAALEAGRHVYSEKPFALSLDEGRDLIDVAQRKGVQLASAPCSLLSEPAQTVWAAIRKGEIGKPLLVLAELSEGMVHRMMHGAWVSPSGAVWPFCDEFQTGCALEHGAYVLTWLTAFFGQIDDITAKSCLIAPEKNAGKELGPDFSCSVMEFASGVVARITFSIISPPDHRLLVVGEEGVLEVADVWDFDSPIYVQHGVATDEGPPNEYLSPKCNYPLIRSPYVWRRYDDSHNIDWIRGVDELAQAIRGNEKSRLSGDRALHILEATLAISGAGEPATHHKMETTFESVQPLPWAQ